MHFFIHVLGKITLGLSKSLFLVFSFRWQSTGFLFMEENKVNGINWLVGLSIMQFIVRMLYG